MEGMNNMILAQIAESLLRKPEQIFSSTESDSDSESSTSSDEDEDVLLLGMPKKGNPIPRVINFIETVHLYDDEKVYIL